MENKPNRTKKIRKGDLVMALTGNNKGQTGVVLSCSGDKVTVQGFNMRKKHVKRSQEAPQGRVIEMEAPLHVSNVRLHVEGEQAVKLKVRTNEQGQRQFVYQKGDQEVVYRSVKKPK